MTVSVEELDKTINWIREYFDKYKINKAVIGLSGGIDSSVVASLCCRALGKENVIGVILPCYSQEVEYNLACKLSDSLNIGYNEAWEDSRIIHFDLEDVFNKFWKDYRFAAQDKIFMPEYSKFVSANIKARLRMTALYAVAGHINGLVVGTTNKTEAILGYATKYGDGGVDIEPIQDFYKGEVYELAGLLNDIPQEIIDRAPSAGLWDGQTDEDELGMTYPEIDICIRALTKDFETPEQEIEITETRKQRMDKIINLIDKNRHKNLYLPYYKRKK